MDHMKKLRYESPHILAIGIYMLLKAILASSQKEDFYLVSTKSGVLRGQVDGDVTTFLGVPYAAAPVEELRFRAPRPHSGWQGVRMANSTGPDCAQPIQAAKSFFPPVIYEFLRFQEYSEDCLNLDIYVPGTVAEARAQPKAVMVWLHGGAYTVGSKHFLGYYNGKYLADKGSVIVVNINYRLAAYGFLAIDHPDFDKNVGFLDQLEALRWVRDNIASFGGDPGRVTIFGESAGGASVVAHILSPLSSGLFHRAIVQSGNIVKTFPTTEQLYKQSTVPLAESLGCEVATLDDIAMCLKTMDADDLSYLSSDHIFFPVVDGDFIPDHPKSLLNSGNINKVPLIIGYNNDDGDVLLSVDGPEIFRSGIPEYLIRPIIDATLESIIGIPEAQRQTIADLVNVNYFPQPDDPLSNLRGGLDFSRDSYFGGPAMWFADRMADMGSANEVYMYRFSHPTGIDLSSEDAIPIGARHGDEVSLIFGTTYIGESSLVPATPAPVTGVTKNDVITLSNTLMTAWALFARGEKTTVFDNEGNKLKWPLYYKRDRAFVDFDVNMTIDNIKQNLDDDANTFWNTVVDTLIETETTVDCLEIPEDVETSDWAPLVRTKSGLINGSVVTDVRSGKTYETFLGIPFANPPRRWQRPEPVTPWAGILNAHDFGNSCSPVSFLKQPFSEDCLFLNIWVPNGVDSILSTNSLLPVVVIIHGGGFESGSGKMNVQGLSIHGEVIVVTINYRLGPFGFMSTGDDTMPGNYGLWDQRAALIWIQSNIAAFGGNKDLVTIGGYSAGGASTTALLASPRARGLFSNVIAMSGSILASFGIKITNPFNDMKVLAESVGCIQDSVSAIISCLQGRSAQDIFDVAWTGPGQPQRWTPVIDGDFFPDSVEILLQDPAIKNINYLGGSLSEEGKMIAGLAQQFATMSNVGVGDAFGHLMSSTTSEGPTVIEAAKLLYFPASVSGDPLKEWQASIGISHDYIYAAPVDRIALIHSRNGGDAYTYDMDYVRVAYRNASDAHGTDAGFYFGEALTDLPADSWTSDEMQLCTEVVKYVSNFAYSGNPNGPKSVNIEWPKYEETQKSYIELGIPEVSSKAGKNERQYVFWNEIVPNMKPNICPALVTESKLTENNIPDGSDENNENDGDNMENNPGKCTGELKSEKFNVTVDQLEAILVFLIAVVIFLLLLLLLTTLIFYKQKRKLRTFRNADQNQNGKMSLAHIGPAGAESPENIDTRI